MRLSIVIPVLNSHSVLRRQYIHWKKIGLPDDIEIIIIDDNSDPPLRTVNSRRLRNLHVYPTGDARPWTQPCARNLGMRIAEGEYVFSTDIDHILPFNAILDGYYFTGDKLEFPREFAVLNNHGDIMQSPAMLFKYGMTRRYFSRRGVRRYKHTNTYVMKRKVFMEIGGYPEHSCNRGTHPTRDDRLLYNRYRKHAEAGNCQPPVMSDVPVYVFPNTTTSGLFHDLPR